MQELATSKNTGNKRIAKNVVFLYVRLFFLLVVGLYTSRIYLDALGVVDFGLYGVVGSLVFIFTFVSGALASSASRFISVEIEVGTPESQNKVFSMTLNIHFIFAVVVLLLSETVGLWYLYNKMVIPEERMFAASVVYQLSCASAILSLLIVPYRALIIAAERMNAFAYLSIVEVLAKLAVAFALYIEGPDKLILYGVMLFVVQAGINLLYLIYCRRSFIISKFRRVWDKLLFKNLLIFSGWTTCSYVSGSVVNQGYNLILNLFCGPVVNAARSVAYQVQTKVLEFATNFQIALNPQIFKNYAATDVRRVEELVEMSIKVSFSLMFVMLFPILVNIQGILSIWLVEVPKDTDIFVVIICVTAIFSAMSNPLGVVAEAANKLKIYNLATIPIFVLALPISYACLYFGLPAYYVFVVALLAEFIGMWVKFLIARGILNNPMRNASLLILKCIGTIILFTGLGIILIEIFDSRFLSVIFCGSVCIVMSAIWVLYIIINRGERIIVYNKIRSVVCSHGLNKG